VELRPTRAPHPPRVVPDPPGRPPGRVIYFQATMSGGFLLHECHEGLATVGCDLLH